MKQLDVLEKPYRKLVWFWTSNKTGLNETIWHTRFKFRYSILSQFTKPVFQTLVWLNVCIDFANSLPKWLSWDSALILVALHSWSWRRFRGMEQERVFLLLYSVQKWRYINGNKNLCSGLSSFLSKAHSRVCLLQIWGTDNLYQFVRSTCNSSVAL